MFWSDACAARTSEPLQSLLIPMFVVGAIQVVFTSARRHFNYNSFHERPPPLQLQQFSRAPAATSTATVFTSARRHFNRASAYAMTLRAAKRCPLTFLSGRCFCRCSFGTRHSVCSQAASMEQPRITQWMAALRVVYRRLLPGQRRGRCCVRRLDALL